jgi:beta-glucosidase
VNVYSYDRGRHFYSSAQIFIVCALALVFSGALCAQSTATSEALSKPPYLDYTLPLDTRVNDLVSRLTQEEKISLLGETQPAIPRLGIGKYHFGNEALHGVVRPGKFTVFPMSIGLASTWDPDLIHEMAAAISDEARGRYNADHGEMENNASTHGLYNGLLTFWSPNLNMARDPRWGRTGETYGEDPFLTSRFGVAFVQGLQGDDPRYLKVVSTPKHFAVHNQERDRMQGQANVSQEALHDYYLKGFQAAIMEGKAESIMTSYNAINGVPSSVNPWLLNDLLRDEWGFKGFVVTDCGAVSNLVKGFHLAKTTEEASTMAINAGVDLECGTNMQRNLGKAQADGLVSTATIDRAVGNLLRGRFRLGMFDPPEMVPYSKISPDVIGSPEHQKIALRAAQESMVLLKNSPYRGKPLLPLNRRVTHSIAIVGPYAAVAQIGDYSGEPFHEPISPLEGIRFETGVAGSIRYVPYTKPDPKQSPNAGRSFTQEAEAARRSDVAIVFVGFGTEAAREGQDRPNLDLSDDQQELVREVVAANARTIVVLVSGGPIAIEWIDGHVPTILEAWYPGEQGGTAIADVLFGKVNPSGRLPLTFYRSTDQLPDMSDYEVTHGRTYQYFTGNPLYPFGHGLSYTVFSYSNLTLDKSIAKPGDIVHARVDITNHGIVDGDEVVQLYFREGDALSGRPIRQLGAFRRIAIARGHTTTVNLDLPVELLKFYNSARKDFVLVPGKITVEVGASSEDLRLRGSFLIETPATQGQ